MRNRISSASNGSMTSSVSASRRSNSAAASGATRATESGGLARAFFPVSCMATSPAHSRLRIAGCRQDSTTGETGHQAVNGPTPVR